MSKQNIKADAEWLKQVTLGVSNLHALAERLDAMADAFETIGQSETATRLFNISGGVTRNADMVKMAISQKIFADADAVTKGVNDTLVAFFNRATTEKNGK